MVSKIASLAVLVTAILSVRVANADELDVFKKRAEAYYDTMIPAYREIGDKSKIVAGNLIDYSIFGSMNEVNAAFQYTFDRNYYSYKKLEGCFASHDAIAKVLLDAIGKEPSGEKERHDYWKANYGYGQLETFSTALNSVQSIYSQCIGDLQRVREFINVMKNHQREKLKVCENVQKSLPYDKLVKLLPLDRTPMSRLRHTWYSAVPLHNISGSILSGGCPDSVVTANCYASKYITWEAVRNQDAADHSYQNYKSHYPELAAASYLTFLAIMNGYEVGTPTDNQADSDLAGARIPRRPGSLSHMGEANLIANLVYVGLLYAQSEQHKKRVEKLNDWLDSKEAELNEAIASSYISEEEFETQKANSCAEKAGSFDQAIIDLLVYFDATQQSDKLNLYSTQFDKIQNWYSSLFLYFVDNQLVDEIAKNRLLSLRDQHYAGLNAAKVKADFAMTQQAIDGVQQEVARTRCAPDSNMASIARNLKKLVGRYQMFCDNALQLYGLRSGKIPYSSSAEEGKVRCYYQGFDEVVKSIRIGEEANGHGSTVQAMGKSGELLFSLQNVSSTTQDSVVRFHPQFYCSVVGPGSFGTDAKNRLQPGIYSMNSDIGLGTPETDISEMKNRVRQKADLIRSKVQRCNVLLPEYKRLALPESNSCQLSGG
ncbi:MAG TPA: hypothetical protein VE954_05860 [Oligoflexus sp.]|uniref:hypothetical protein n=1 Tax=Oligoflexus sp. TaxID=1971216 RepID=UPI002D25B914|nr:hypothetical protein [Oligoflexus sp.]HYX32618.1 hypothetical protein [Oligoflexus sp.]